MGPAQGFARVVRGGGLDSEAPYFARSVNRGAIAPAFPPASAGPTRASLPADSGSRDKAVAQKPEGFRPEQTNLGASRKVLNEQGKHPIGIRVVLAPMPKTKPAPPQVPFVRQCVKQDTQLAKLGPDPNKPYFRKRYILPIPPENLPESMIVKAVQTVGLHPGMLRHNHSPAVEVCPNGDVLAVYYTSVGEYSPDVALIATRLRFGSDQWEMPSLLLDFADVNDHAPLLWNDRGKLFLFWGNTRLRGGFPFQWITSSDNGATWSEVRFPVFENAVGGHSPQPINTAFRGSDGTIYVASDAVGPQAVLWVSHNNGETWADPGGRSAGRHTTFVMLKDGRILAMGGKDSSVNGYMPKTVSSDGGKTFAPPVATPFSMLGSNQRPIILRLASGRLFFAGDFQRSNGFQPEGIHERGSYAALSDDEGETWHLKKLPGAQVHESAKMAEAMKGSTLGYSVARQAPNGIIHLITSMNHPSLHFAFNEAWLLQKENTSDDAVSVESAVRVIKAVKTYEEKDRSGKIHARWSAGVGDDGTYLLHGAQTWYYENGKKQWEVTFDSGRKVGQETYWSPEGVRLWSWEHRPDGTSIWTHWWPNGSKKTESTWRNFQCEGMATQWDQAGQVVRQVKFEHGMPVD